MGNLIQQMRAKFEDLKMNLASFNSDQFQP
jgi:hypothetical protein